MLHMRLQKCGVQIVVLEETILELAHSCSIRREYNNVQRIAKCSQIQAICFDNRVTSKMKENYVENNCVLFLHLRGFS